MLDLVVGAVLCLGACVLGLSFLASYGLKAGREDKSVPFLD